MQGAYYIRQQPFESVLNIDELKEMVDTNQSNVLMNKLMYYAKNVTGTNSYWNQQRNNLKATISQMGPPTIFWTLSCAEFHWPQLHACPLSQIFYFRSRVKAHNNNNNIFLVTTYKVQ